VFFAPIFASVPPWATGCTLVLVNCIAIPLGFLCVRVLSNDTDRSAA
jgi:hypothetical protein